MTHIMAKHPLHWFQFSLRTLLLLTTLIAIGLTELVYVSRENMPLPSLEPPAVAKIEAGLMSRKGKIDRFNVNAADYEKVLGLFRDARVDRWPMDWASMGGIWITYKNGRSTFVWVFASNQERGAFKVSGTYYRGSSDDTFVRTLKECHERAKAVEKTVDGT